MSVYSEGNSDVTLAAAGDREAFVRLVQTYATTVQSIALAIVRDVHASQDIAQDVFLVAWRDVKKLRNAASFLPWLRQITRNRSNEWLRTERARVTDRDADAILAATVDPRLSAPEVLEVKEQQRIVGDIIGMLPDESREVITLFYSEGRSVRQVAELLGIAEGAVKKRLSRARERIREELLEQFGSAMTKASPAAAVIAAVSVSVASATPGVAASSSMTVAKVAGGSILGKIAAGASGALVGAALGSAGLMSGVRRNMAKALDDEERAEWKRFGRIGVAIITAAAFGIALSGYLESALLLVIVQALFVTSLTVMYISWAPKIMKRRIEAEIARDPSAAQRIRRARLLAWTGLAAGIIISSATVVWAVMKLLR